MLQARTEICHQVIGGWGMKTSKIYQRMWDVWEEYVLVKKNVCKWVRLSKNIRNSIQYDVRPDGPKMASIHEMMASNNTLISGLQRTFNRGDFWATSNFCWYSTKNCVCWPWFFKGQLSFGFTRTMKCLIHQKEEWKSPVSLFGKSFLILLIVQIFPPLISTYLALSKNLCLVQSYQAMMKWNVQWWNG